MKVQILGSGCPGCRNLYELTKNAVDELGLKADVEHVTDVMKLVEMGIMTSPVLMIDGEPVMYGSTSSIEKVKDLLKGGKVEKERSECCKDCCKGESKCCEGCEENPECKDCCKDESKCCEDCENSENCCKDGSKCC